VSVFRFNMAHGDLEEVGKPYSIPSPNFICAVDSWKLQTDVQQTVEEMPSKL